MKKLSTADSNVCDTIEKKLSTADSNVCDTIEKKKLSTPDSNACVIIAEFIYCWEQFVWYNWKSYLLLIAMCVCIKQLKRLSLADSNMCYNWKSYLLLIAMCVFAKAIYSW